MFSFWFFKNLKINYQATIIISVPFIIEIIMRYYEKMNESKEELKTMNKKLVKMVAVASLAALMTIPNLTTPVNNSNIVYAGVAESLQKNIKHAQEMIEKFKKEGNEEGVKNWTENLKKWQDAMSSSSAIIKEESERRLRIAQKAAQAQAAQAEKERIANTVYPLTARYVKDFVPAVDDYQPHFYERADLPGFIFTLQQDSFGKLMDVKPNLVIVEDNDIERVVPMFDGSSYDTIFQVIKVKYISPFNFVGRINLGVFHLDVELNKAQLGSGWCHYIGENMECFMIDGYHYTPTVECIKKFQELKPEYLPTIYDTAKLYSEKPKLTVEEIKSKGKVYFHTEERVKKSSGINKKLGATWVNDQDIFSVAKEHGTDYTDEERQTLVIKPTPVNPYTNAGSEPIVDEQEWIDANINYDRNPQSISDEEWWK